MEFPITDSLSQEQREAGIMSVFDPEGLTCPGCRASVAEAYVHRQPQRIGLTVYRCKQCRQTYSLSSEMVFQQCHSTSQQTVLLLLGVVKGEPSTT